MVMIMLASNAFLDSKISRTLSLAGHPILFQGPKHPPKQRESCRHPHRFQNRSRDNKPQAVFDSRQIVN